MPPSASRHPIVVHTGPADRAGRWLTAIKSAGIEARSLPMIASVPVTLTGGELERAAAGAPYGLVVVTSPRAAAALPQFQDWIRGAQVAAVGAATAKACAEHAFATQWNGSGGAAPFLRALAARIDVAGMSVLHPCGDLSHEPGLPELAGRGARVVAPVVYRTEPVTHPREAVTTALESASGVTFTSPSGVCSFVAAIEDGGVATEARRLFAAALGTITENAARKAGFPWRGIPRRPEPAALAGLLVSALKANGT